MGTDVDAQMDEGESASEEPRAGSRRVQGERKYGVVRAYQIKRLVCLFITGKLFNSFTGKLVAVTSAAIPLQREVITPPPHTHTHTEVVPVTLVSALPGSARTRARHCGWLYSPHPAGAFSR
jgi:hypothetical protein